MTAPDVWRLLVDVGGTNIRFGRTTCDRVVRDSRTWPLRDFARFELALAAYLAELDATASCAAVAIAGAGPVSGDRIDLTNSPWAITRAAVVETFARPMPVRLYNDLEAVALSLPHLEAAHLRPIASPPKPSADTACGRLLGLNVGTGFGSAVAIAFGDGWVPCPAESGHIPLGARNEDELAVLTALDLARPPTWEDVLSGDGLVSLYRAVASHRGAATAADSTLAPETIFARAGSDPLAGATLELFTRLLARAAASMVLAGAAWDGLFLCGGVATAWSECADLDAFRRDFVLAGKMQDRLAAVPISTVTLDLPAFVGLANVPIDG